MPEKHWTPGQTAQVLPSAHSSQGNSPSHSANLKHLPKDDQYPSLQQFAAMQSTSKDKDEGCQQRKPPASEPLLSPNAPWAGSVPATVLLKDEFKQAHTTYVDEPAERAAGRAKHKEERKERKSTVLKAGPLRWLRGEPRETQLEQLSVQVMSMVVGYTLFSFLYILNRLGQRQNAKRIFDEVREFLSSTGERQQVRQARDFAHQWWPYRLAVRIIANVQSGAQPYLQ